MPDDWAHSSEGDLDPDLTEEAGYSGWEPATRTGWSWGARALVVAVLIALAGGTLLALVR